MVVFLFVKIWREKMMKKRGKNRDKIEYKIGIKKRTNKGRYIKIYI